MRVGGWEANPTLSYLRMHPIILHGKHPITRLFIRSEHIGVLHAGLTLLSSFPSHRFSIVGLRETVRSLTRQCITYRCQTTQPWPQMLGQLPLEHVTPGSIIEEIEVDYVAPLYVKYGMVCKTSARKAYVCLFISLAIKAVHLELVSDLTAEAFITTLRGFFAWRGYSSLIWSDHCSNFISTNCELTKLHEFFAHHITQGTISQFYSI